MPLYIDIKYSDYVKLVGRANVKLFYDGNITSAENLFNLVKCQKDTENIDIDLTGKVFNAEEYDIELKSNNIALQLEVELGAYHLELPKDAVKELYKFCESWNKKYSQRVVAQGVYRIDLTEEMERLEEESRDNEYCV